MTIAAAAPETPATLTSDLVARILAVDLSLPRKAELPPMEPNYKAVGVMSENLQRLLELRLDNVIYRLGLAKTRNQARQLVNHGFFLINGKKVDIPSCQVRVKDEITIKPQKLKTKVFEPAENNLKKIQLPGWLNFDSQTLKARVVAEPTAAEMERSFNPKLIIEVYSK